MAYRVSARVLTKGEQNEIQWKSGGQSVSACKASNNTGGLKVMLKIRLSVYDLTHHGQI